MHISLGAVMVVLVVCVIVALSFVFRQRFAPMVLFFGVACVIWLVVSYYLDLTLLYKIINIYVVIGVAAVCTTAGVAGILFRLIHKWFQH